MSEARSRGRGTRELELGNHFPSHVHVKLRLELFPFFFFFLRGEDRRASCAYLAETPSESIKDQKEDRERDGEGRGIWREDMRGGSVGEKVGRTKTVAFASGQRSYV